MLGAAAWVAAVVAAMGFVSLLTGAEVMPIAAAGPLAVPIGIASGALLIGVRGGRATAAATLLPIELLLGCALLPLLGAAAVALVTSPGAAFLTIGRLAVSPFPIVDGILGGGTGLVLLLVARARAAGASRPRWPWEDRNDE